jgi:hypothetical protein
MRIDLQQTDEIPDPARNNVATTEPWRARGFRVGTPIPRVNHMQESWPQFSSGIPTVNGVGNPDEFPPGNIDTTPADRTRGRSRPASPGLMGPAQ